MFRVRVMKEADIPRVAEIHVRTWQKAYAGIISSKYLDSLSIEKRTQGWANGLKVNPDVVRLVILEKKEVIGFAAGLENRSHEMWPDIEAELWSLYLHPDYWNKNAGKKLFMAFNASMEEKGFRSFLVWVLKENLRGRKFYEKMGGNLLQGSQSIQLDDLSYEEVAYVFKID